MGPEILLGLKRQHCTPLYRQVVTFSRLRGRQRGRTNEAGLEERPTLPSRCKIRFQNSCYDLFRLRPVNEAILGANRSFQCEYAHRWRSATRFIPLQHRWCSGIRRGRTGHLSRRLNGFTGPKSDCYSFPRYLAITAPQASTNSCSGLVNVSLK